MNIKIDVNAAEVQKILKGVPAKIVTPSLVTAINRAARDGKTSAIKATSRATGVKQKAIRKRITGGNTGNAKASRKRLSSLLFIRTNEGVKVSQALNKSALKKLQTRKSFVATMPSGHKAIWERNGKPKRAAKKGRYYGKVSSRGPGKGRLIKREPISELKIPLHPVGTEAAKKAFTQRAKVTLPNELKNQITRKLNAQAARNTRSGRK